MNAKFRQDYMTKRYIYIWNNIIGTGKTDITVIQYIDS